MLHARAQRELQAVTQAAQVHRQRAVAIDPGVGAPDQFLLRVAVVHRKGVQIHWRVAAGQRAKINGPAFDTAAKERLVDLRGQLKPVAGLGVQALAQRRA